jgi:hypothetical protein
MSWLVHRQCESCGRKFSFPSVAPIVRSLCNECTYQNEFGKSIDNKLGIQRGVCEGDDIEETERHAQRN